MKAKGRAGRKGAWGWTTLYSVHGRFCGSTQFRPCPGHRPRLAIRHRRFQQSERSGSTRGRQNGAGGCSEAEAAGRDWHLSLDRKNVWVMA